MNAWPATALLAHSPSYSDVQFSYNGSARLADPSVRPVISNALRTYCSNGNQCVVVCYSAGCLRYLLAVDDLKASQTPATGIQWVQAAASAAGGSELADVSTNAGIRLIIKIFGVTGAQDPAMIDWDLKIASARGSLLYLQNGSPAPMYHTAGNQNICQRVKPSSLSVGGIALTGANFLVNGSLGNILASGFGNGLISVAGPVGVVIAVASGLFSIFSSTGVKLCGNSRFPGGYGDGAVPVHSAAGYADTAAHANHNDGGPKYLFRAYEQIPLFPVDHVGAFGPLVQAGSLRLAVNKTAACANSALSNATDPDASIVYQDADTAREVEASPLFLLNVCGASALSDPEETSTCLGTMGCCANFSTANTGTCTCGESLCLQSRRSYVSYFTDAACAGTEYSISNDTWDGVGMIGTATVNVAMRSVRKADGFCYATTKAMRYAGCVDYFPVAKTFAAKRVYRPSIGDYRADPSGARDFPGFVVQTQQNAGMCP